MTTRTTTLGLEPLETREVPAIVVANTPAFIMITTDGGGSDVTIGRQLPTQKLTITNNQTGQTWKFSQGVLDFKSVVFVGGSGADKVTAVNCLNPVVLHGKGGNDTLTGGLNKDYLDGGSGNDTVKGGNGRDTLYGRGGIDKLYGEQKSDFLDDGGSSADVSDGGSGDDFFARQVVKFGTIAPDVIQTGTPTCWVLAPLSAAAQQGVNFASRITYLGDGDYRVKLMNEDGGYKYQYVSLEGGKLDFEPKPRSEESWVVIMHRAIMQEIGVNWKDIDAYSGGSCGDIMSMLTGRPTDTRTAYVFAFTDGDLQDMRNALLQGKVVAAGTDNGNYGDFGFAVNTPKLVGSHCYHVLNVNFETKTVTLRNPWGTDGWDCYDGDDDGIVKVSFDQFKGSFDTLAIS
jgi:Ca2+-binding RTX toxin-like protein